MQSTTASDLRAQAELFRNAARKLDDAADILDRLSGTNAMRVFPAAVHEPSRVSRDVDQPVLKRKVTRGSRLGELRAFLEQNGPSLRRHILAQSGLPTGTVSMLLNEKNGFFKGPDGRWGIVTKSSTNGPNN